MRYIAIADGLPPSSILGFGCSGAMGRVGRAQSLRSIAAALDAGITHFDVARSYGYGEAEALLGEALGHMRHRVVIATKFGLSASSSAVAFRRLKPLARHMLGKFPAFQSALKSFLNPSVARAGRFSTTAAQASLDQSLAALKTDYIDLLFMHDCRPTDVTDELLDFLAAQVAAGKIRAYGAATSVDAIELIATERSMQLVYQFRNSLMDQNARRIVSRARPFITHGPFFRADALMNLIERRPEILAPLHRRTLSSAEVHEIMLAYALGVEGVGPVVCSMLDDKHVAANVASMDRSQFSPAQVSAFAEALNSVEY